jgi:FMN phosphatase YigB (HAD superfamily)
MAGGRVLRQVLEHYGLLRYFQTTVFSNEFGRSKPHAAIFEHALAALGGIEPSAALHVGDVEELDVEGARRAAMHAALYAPDMNEEVQTQADFVVTDWRDFDVQIEKFVMPGD